MELERIPRRKNRKLPGKRLGRGYGSGVGGHTVGRGMKGQKSRSGHKSTVFFEGGNRPFLSRMPKYPGFKNLSKIDYAAINLETIDKLFKSGETVSLESLKEKGLVRKRDSHAKILGNGDISKKINIKGLPVSKVAVEKIVAAGGKIEN